jgi:hypothetical protein
MTPISLEGVQGGSWHQLVLLFHTAMTHSSGNTVKLQEPPLLQASLNGILSSGASNLCAATVAAPMQAMLPWASTCGCRYYIQTWLGIYCIWL